MHRRRRGDEQEDEFFELALWSRSDGSHIGKSFYFHAERGIYPGFLGVYTDRVERIKFSDLQEMAQIIRNLPPGSAFATSGLPEAQSAHVEVASATDGISNIARTKDYVRWPQGVGGYFVVDFDSHWCPWKLEPSGVVSFIVDRFICAASKGGLELGDVSYIYYESASSSVALEDGATASGLSRHVIFLVRDLSDLPRFRDAMDVYLAISDASYGAVSSAGTFLERGILDRAAVRVNQPTFMAEPFCRDPARCIRNVRVHEGTKIAIDTHSLADPNDWEIRKAFSFWGEERLRLKDDLERQRKNWLEARVDGLVESWLDQGEVIERSEAHEIIRRRLSYQLVVGDMVVIDDYGEIDVRSILESPTEFNRRTGPDPIEPDYCNSRQVAMVLHNEVDGTTCIHSFAHGGQVFQLMWDTASAIEIIEREKNKRKTFYRLLHSVCPTSRGDIDEFLSLSAKMCNVRKSTLVRECEAILVHALSGRTHGSDTNQFYVKNVHSDDLGYLTALDILEDRPVECVAGQIWFYELDHWVKKDDLAVEQIAQTLLLSFGSFGKSSVAAKSRDAVAALKQLSHRANSPITKSPGKVLNFQNGELWFLTDGRIEVRPHNPESGLTYVLPCEYDPSALAPVFSSACLEMFMPGWRERKVMSEAQLDEYRRLIAEPMRRHLLEIMAYLVVPERWQACWCLWKGEGSNGKTLLSEVLIKLLPEGAVEAEDLAKISESNFGMSRLHGKTLLLDDDLKTNTVLNDGFLKKVSERKRLSADIKHRPESLSFENTAAALILANNWPRIVDVSPGFVRRMLALKFEREFLSEAKLRELSTELRKDAEVDRADSKLLEKIGEELSGIAALLVESYRELTKRGGWDLPQKAIEAAHEALSEGNPLPRFIDSNCKVEAGCDVRRSDFHNAVRRWAEEERLSWSPTAQQIGNQMRQLGFLTKKLHGHEHYSGIGLQSTVADSV